MRMICALSGWRATPDRPRTCPTPVCPTDDLQRWTSASGLSGRLAVHRSVSDTSSSGQPLIHARALSKCFGSFTAVDGIDFDVAPGEAFGFLGPNGAGKTSTMRMIGTVSPVSTGELTVFGLDPAHHGARI